MNLQCALDTLKTRVEILRERHKRSLERGWEHAARWYAGELSGVQYAIDVLEAAMGDGK